MKHMTATKKPRRTFSPAICSDCANVIPPSDTNADNIGWNVWRCKIPNRNYVTGVDGGPSVCSVRNQHGACLAFKRKKKEK